MSIVTNKTSDEETEREVRAIRKATKRASASKETAKAYLRKRGIITKSGKLTKKYGG